FQVEFAVEMTCRSCEDAVQHALDSVPGIQSTQVDLKNETVIVETSLAVEQVRQLIENTGRRVVVKGMGSGVSHLGAAVCMMSGSAVGLVRMIQINPDTCLFEGTIDGLQAGEHGLHVHEYGDISLGAESCGNHFNPTGAKHGGRTDIERHIGDLGNIRAEENGRAVFRFTDNRVKIWDIIGRSMIVHAAKDDLGRGDNASSRIDGNSGPGVAWGIVARSAGLFENVKTVCACDGIRLWDERDVPLAGPSRSNNTRSYVQAQL
ncbi:PREDICTED: copper chaperone for superoxide dismutase-like, partial [Priapulus caudatus]|uniref:Superoxide dismutase copper chaperone n=1 Tax=Priapulus caudatus TaxID=37621 RepID=A0ABM1EYB0_PRICU